jgi:glycosyltransferase involved in cell wall biosynthesis
MNVCMLTYSFYESDNRVRRYAETLVRRGESVDVISLRRKGQGVHNELNGVRIFRLQERVRDERGRSAYLFRILKFFCRSLWDLSAKHVRRSYQLIHVHSVPDFEVFAALIPKLAGAKIILDIHDIVPELYASKFGVSRDSITFKSLVLAERAASSFADHVIISNDLWRETLISRSVPPAKCTTILNYPDEHIFCCNKVERDDSKFIFLYPGTLNLHQGLDLAVEAIERIKDKAPRAELHIYGDGPARPMLDKQVKDLRLEDRVHFKAPVSLDDIPSVMACADVGIIPKRNNNFGGDAFSTKTLEFMRLGVPIIVARTRIDQHYFDDTLVRFFEPESIDDLADAMLNMVEDGTFRTQLAKKALDFVGQFSWDVKKSVYLDMVDSLVSPSHR